MSRRRSTLILLLLAALAACYEPPRLPPLAHDLPLVTVSEARATPLGVHGPTDVVALPDGDALVLDGLRGRLLRVSADGADVTPVPLPPPVGQPVRLAQAQAGGLWLVDPGGPLRRVSIDGELLQTLPLPVEPGQPAATPLDLHDQGATLLLADREGRLRRVDAQTGATLTLSDVPLDEALHATLVDLSSGPAGLLAADARGARVLTLEPSGAIAGRIGAWGHHAGRLAHPKAALALDPDTVLVADSELDALSVFSTDGGFVGLLAEGDQPLRPTHPLALARGPEAGRIWVLDAAPGDARLIALSISIGSLSAAKADVGTRRLRVPLVEDRAVAGPESCAQCHDGLVQGGRDALDPDAAHHPLGVAPPDGATLGSDGPLTCATCHTPHADGSGGDFLRASADNDTLCVACHGGEPHGTGVGAHPSGAALRLSGSTREAGGGCVDCHTPHAAQGAALTRDSTSDAACGRCHAAQAVVATSHPRAGAGGAAVAHAGLPLDTRGHLACRTCHQLVGGAGPALLRAEPGALCQSCHEPVEHGAGACLGCHAPHEAASPRALLHARSAPAACRACHAGVGQAGHPVSAKGEVSCDGCHRAHDPTPATACATCHATQTQASGHGGLPCAACHPAHDAAPAGPDDAHPANTACLACHDASGGATRLAAWSHPVALYDDAAPPDGALPLYGDDGQPVPAGQPGALACGSCHETHGSDRDHLRRADWQPTCASCHGTQALLLYQGFHAPRSAP